MAETLSEFLARAGGRPVLASACLLGLATRYDMGTLPYEPLIEYAREHCVIPVCPEQLGGLPTPRQKSSFRGGGGEQVLSGRAKLSNESGRDVTENFLRGARQTAAIARLVGARFAVLKEKSPSCGVTLVHVDGALVEGSGVTTAVLRKAGIEIFVVP